MLSRRAISFECSWARRCISAQSDFAFATAGTLNASSTAAQHSQVDFISDPFKLSHRTGKHQARPSAVARSLLARFDWLSSAISAAAALFSSALRPLPVVRHATSHWLSTVLRHSRRDGRKYRRRQRATAWLRDLAAALPSPWPPQRACASRSGAPHLLEWPPQLPE